MRESNIDRDLDPHRAALARDPDNLELATAYWRALANCRGHNVRDGSHPVEAFRAAALSSPEGIVALCVASQELCRESGECPSTRYFDQELVSALQHSLHKLPIEDAENVRWVLACLKEAAV